MKGRAASRTVRRPQVRAALVASFLLLSSTPVWPAERADLLLLPASVPLYTRNNECTDVKVPMPPSTHSAIGANMISPQPADMPLSQGDSAICFAYATADMISQRVQTEISALDVATKYYLTNPSRLRNWLIRICSSSPRNGGLSDSDCRKPEHNRCLERR
jgi:hypothetical protein